MDKELKREYKREIREIKKQNLETLSLLLKYGVEDMIESIDNIDKNMKVLDEVHAITVEEKMLLNFIKRNLKKIDSNELDKVLDLLDEINEKTVAYYYYLMDNIGVDMIKEKQYRGLETIIETEKYRKEVFGLTLCMDDVINYLNYDESFWSYILPRTIRIDDEELRQVNIKCDINEVIEDIKVFVPNVINLKTAKINIHEFTHAYDIFKMIGIQYLDKDYEEIAVRNENDFEANYVNQKVKRRFG